MADDNLNDGVDNVPPAIRGEDHLNAPPIRSVESAAALDKLLAEAKPDADADKPDDGKPADPPAKPDGDKPDDGKPADPPAKPDVDKPGDGKPADSLAKPDAVPPTKDRLDGVELPPYSKPKTTEAFEKVKALAREDLATREKTIQELTAQVDKVKKEYETKLQEAQAQLEDLTKWRQAIEVEDDPTFKEFDTQQTKNVENILNKLREAGIEESYIAEIKKHNAKIVWDDVWSYFEKDADAKAKLKVPLSTLRRYIEGKLIANETLADEKRDKLAAAKQNAAEFLKTRSEKQKVDDTKASEQTATTVQKVLGQLPWSSETKIPDTAPPEQRKVLEAQNQFAREIKERIGKMLADRSPEAVGEYIAGTAMAYFFKSQADFNAAQLKESQEAVKKLTDELERIKKASGAGRQPSSAARRPVDTAKETLFARGEDALDRIRDEVVSRS